MYMLGHSSEYYTGQVCGKLYKWTTTQSNGDFQQKNDAKQSHCKSSFGLYQQRKMSLPAVALSLHII